MNFRQEFDAGLAQEALRPAVEDVVQKIANQAGAFASIQPPASPAQIVGANGGSFYIDKDENYGILVGQRYEVHRVIDEIRDANGNLLDSITDAVGLLEVTRVSDSRRSATSLKAIRSNRQTSAVSPTDLYIRPALHPGKGALDVLWRAHICPICSFFTPCWPGASPVSVYRSVELTTLAPAVSYLDTTSGRRHGLVWT